MLRQIAFVSTFALALPAFGQTVNAPSPLPIFDLESGNPIVLESIITPNTLQDVGAVRGTDLYDHARIVARVEDLSGSGFCSGFRVGEDLFMTNYHCWEVYDCNTQFHMYYEEGLPTDQQGIWKCKEVITKLERLDFALYRVEAVGTIPAGIDFPISNLSKQELTVGMPLLVPGHPATRPKQIDVSEQCKLTRAIPYSWYDRDNIQHQCDTEGGSSGSPVIDRATGNVVGIHWGATGGTDSNHAIPMNLILPYLEEQVPAVYAELTVVE